MFIKKIKNNNAFADMLQRLFIFFFIFVFILFFVDLIFFAVNMITTNHQLQYVSSKLQFQSGFIGSSKSSSNQWTNKEIYDYLDAGFKSIGIDGTNLTWSLEYDSDIYSGGGDVLVLDSAGTKRYSFVSFGRVNSYDNLDDLENSTIYEKSAIKVNFDYKFRFSGKILNLLNILSRITLSSTFTNEYIN